MASLRNLHRLMNDRQSVLLTDGRTGKVVRVDTLFPGNDTTVTVYTRSPQGPSVAKVALAEVIGQAPRAAR